MSKDVKDYISIIGNRLGKAFSIDSFGTEEELEFWALSAEHMSRKKNPAFQNIISWIDLLYQAPVHFVYKLEKEHLILIKRQLISENLLSKEGKNVKKAELDTKRAEFIQDFEGQMQNLEKKRQWDEDFKEFGVSAHTIGNCEHIPLYKRNGDFWGIYVVGPNIKSPENMVPKMSIISRLLSSWLIELEKQEKKSQKNYQEKIQALVGDLGSGALNTEGFTELILLYVINVLKAHSGAVIEYRDGKPILISSNNLSEVHLKSLMGLSGDKMYEFESDNFKLTDSGQRIQKELDIEPLFLPYIKNEIKGFIWINRLEENQAKDNHPVLGDITEIVSDLFEFRNSNEIFSNNLVEAFYKMLRAVEGNREKTKFHTPRMIAFIEMFGMIFGLDAKEMEILKLTAKLHDIGYVGAAGISSMASIGSELAHPIAGSMMLSNLPIHEDVINGIKTHHEWVNGKGTPNGLIGEDIPWTGKIIAVYEYIVDFFESNSNVAPEKEEEMMERLKSNIIERADIHFDLVLIPTVIQQLTMLGWSGCAQLGVDQSD
jgi:HD-GYP domain-containing protein (c-di-GMP phosphodiesterase class II)